MNPSILSDRHRGRFGALFVLIGLASSVIVGQTPSTPNRTPVALVEVTVAADDGQSMPDLLPAEFEVSLDGNRRRVTVAQSTRVYAAKPGTDGSPVVVEGQLRYRLGFEPEPSDYDGNPHQLSVTIVAPGRRFKIEAPAQVRLPKSAGAPAPQAAQPRVNSVPAATDVAAWERLWGGADVIAAAAKAATPARPADPPARTPVAVEPPDAMPTAATPLDNLFARYSSGDKVVVFRELQTPDDFERVRPDLTRTFGRWRSEPWSSERAAFALEIAIAAYGRHWPNPQLFLDAARDLVISRSDAPGTRPEADRFELCFHRVAVAMLATVDGPHSVETYLTSIQRRVMLGTDASRSALLKDARLLMAHAMAREAQTLMLLLSVNGRRDSPRAWVVAPGDGGTRRQLEEIARQLELAAADDDVRAEASVRRAFLLYRLGANKEALALLEAATPPDDVVDFWRVLIEGRVLLALGREQDAISAFERAAELYPDAQTPAVALMRIFLKSGDRELALGWAERARTTTENRGDPWTLYWSGQTRFFVRWLGELREFQN
jgi:hypothetical protein